MKHLKVYWSGCVLMMLATSASATTIVMPTDDQLIAKSPVIVEGTVVSTVPVARGNAIWTQTTLSIARTIKGNVAGNITINEAGGILDDRITKVFGAPEYAAGEHVLLFLAPSPRGGYQTTDLYVGKFTEERTLDGRMLWSRHDETGDVVLLDSNFNPIHAANVQRDAVAFSTYVGDRVAGRTGAKNYGMENPVLDTIRGGIGGDRFKANFTLISEPQVYRWTAFDSGGSANWVSYGTQPGYAGGGVSEIQTAMNAWNSYASAKIRYNYSGAGSGSPAGLSAANGVNEVLFNDPLGEISGSWSPSTGGIVGRGGFNGVSGSATWNAPFTYDAAHTQKAYTAFRITEGNLVIQDNVSPSAGLSSARLAEIVAHELGHTLGFGHSTDSTALMYATLAGLGPTLRADDQDAARWLYPNGTQTPPPTVNVPAAPTNLGASASGSNVIINWTDNANNETGQSVYVAVGSGAFSKVTDVAVNATSATLTGFSAGTYGIYVVAFNSAGNSPQSNTASVTIGAPAQVQASFNVSATSGVAGQTNFSFTDQSTGPITSRLWQFADGTTSTLQNPTHVFGAAGQYSVILTVSGSGLSSSTTRTIFISSPAAPLVASFSWSPSNPTTSQDVSFADQSTGGITGWQWSFGDGTSSSAQNPAKRYNSSGAYNVTLTVFRNSEASATSRQLIVTAAAPPPPATETTRTLISAAAQTNGIGGSVWRTELTLFNAGPSAAITMIYLPDNGSILNRTIALGAKQSVTYANTLLEVFGLSSGAGAIAIEATSSGATPDLRVTSRTFTNSPTGTYGQAVPDVLASDLQSTMYLTALASSASYRTNIGLVNRTGSTASATLQLFDANGGLAATNNLSIGPNSFQQGSLATYFPAVSSRTLDAASMVITSASSGAISAYASVIDNRTQDPVYEQATPQRGINSTTIIPGVGRTGGLNGTFWRSDVTIYNPNSSPTSVSYRLLMAGSDNRNAAWQSAFIGARQTVVLSDVVSRFTGTANVSGALEMGWSSNPPVITSRTYTTNGSGGTFGQSVDPVSAFSRDQYVPGIRSDSAFRANVGFVNSGEVPIGINVSLLSPNGLNLGSGFVALPPKSQQQYSLGSLFPGLNVNTLGNVTLQAHTDSAATLFAYASLVDNVSGDPVCIGGK